MPKNTTVNGEVEQLREDLSQLRDDVKDLARALLDAGHEKAREAKSRVTKSAEAGVENIRERIESILDGGRKAGARVKKSVADRPTLSLMSAFGIGFLLAKFLDR